MELKRLLGSKVLLRLLWKIIHYMSEVLVILVENVILNIQGPPVNRAIWQRCFSIFSVSGEGE
jgi:hypothetical protein